MSDVAFKHAPAGAGRPGARFKGERLSRSHTGVWLNGHIRVSLTTKTRFEWDPTKDQENQDKHGVDFALAQLAFADPRRVIAKDHSHSSTEERYYCFGAVGGAVLTVRFTYRPAVIRIYGAGYWRKGKRIYERENSIHRRTPRRPRGRP